MMLVAAKWRDFCVENPDLIEGADDEKAKASTPVSRQDDDMDDDDEDSKSSSKKGSRRSIRKGGKSTSTKSKSKVPTLKIRIGKRKRGSSVNYPYCSYTQYL